ncbi:hypothetical protein SBD_3874 [Streptomyces bottropensis ATCC 25435]|uniref:Uncharacterized protein n=1 Tax=Streptomyces bottropensis ATCC 25435 TaxID=1054862 RepID=M3EDF6_9ACTN|nr:hypothetical protein SBD_3874 [Streptomyces bottropensis ATCC 25435]
MVDGRPYVDDRYAPDGGGARPPGGLAGWRGRGGRTRARGACGGALWCGAGGTGRRGW